MNYHPIFTFIQTNPNYYTKKKWSSFIKNCVKKCNQIGIPIDECYIQSILQQHIYTTYLLPTQIFYSFDYSIECIPIYDISFWKVCKFIFADNTFYYHKKTNALFQINTEIEWKGIFDFSANRIILPNECPEYVQRWFLHTLSI